MSSMVEIFEKKEKRILKDLFDNREKMIAILDKQEELEFKYAQLIEKENNLLNKHEALYKDIPLSMVKKNPVQETTVQDTPRLYEPRRSSEYAGMMRLLAEI